MASSINASTAGAGGVITTADNSGVLNLQSGGTTVATVSSTGFSTPANQTINAANTFGFKNRIINGGMTIDQRNAGASVTPTVTNTYTLDRWAAVLSVASKYSVQQNAGSVTPPAGFINYLGVTSLSAYTVGAAEVFLVNQRIEGLNVADLSWGTANAKTVTLSFWVRSSLTGTFGGSLKNSDSTRSYPFSYTISAANTWEQKTITVAGDTTGTWLTTNGIGINVGFSLGAGSTLSGTAGAWAGANYVSATGATSVVGTNGATFYITGVQLEVGSQATSFDFRSYGTELALCQRYYEKSYDISVAPGTGSNSGRFQQAGSSNSGGDMTLNIRFCVVKRTNPTMTAYTAGTGTVGSWRRTSSVSGASDATLNWEFQGTGGSCAYIAQGGGNVTCTTEGQWAASAEL